MYCPKCGKQNQDGAVFCCFCGFSMKFEATTPPVASPIQPTPTGQPVQQVHPAQPVQPMQPVQPIIPNFPQTSDNNAAVMKNSKKRFILPICISAVVVICAVLAIILIPRLGKVPVSEPDDDSIPTASDGDVPGTSGDDVSGTPGGVSSTPGGSIPGTPGGNIPGTSGGSIPGTSGGSIPGTPGGVSIPSGNEDPGNNPSGELRMTLNGKNIPVKMSMFYSIDGKNYVIFLGKTNDQLFGVSIFFMEGYPQANSSYNETKNGNDIIISLRYSGKEAGSRDGYYKEIDIQSYDSIAKWNVSIDGFEPNKSMEISASGSMQEDAALVFKFEASGKMNFQSKSMDDVSSEVGQWLENNKIPAKGGQSAKEIEIKGKKYSTDLTYLDLSGQGLSNRDIKDLDKMAKLTRINLDDNNLTDISVLKNIPTLVEIDAKNNRISDISFIKSLKNLEIFVLNGNNVKDISAFSQFTTIKKIWLNDNKITDISPIAKNKGLTEVGFNNCPIGDISALQGMSKIELLCLDNCGITDISPLSSCKALSEVNLNSNPITDFSPLTKLYNLDKVGLYNCCRMTRNILKTFHGLTFRTELNLAGNSITADMADELLEMVHSNGTVKW